MTGPSVTSPGLVLSLFPGIDILGRGFEMEGFCVVRGPEKILGGDIREFHAPAGRFEGVIGGPPCPEFSSARREEPTGEGVELLAHFLRVVAEAQPQWWLMENVERVPDVTVRGYTVQRFDLNARECGLPQNRPRHFQYGSRDGSFLRLERDATIEEWEPCVTASEGQRGVTRRRWEKFCALQGLAATELDLFNRRGRYRVVGNAVPLPMARRLARAVLHPLPSWVVSCACGCGRDVTPRAKTATEACRQRYSRQLRGINTRQTVTDQAIETGAARAACGAPAPLSLFNNQQLSPASENGVSDAL